MATAKCKCVSHGTNERWHGNTSGYTYHSCRCTICVNGWNSYCQNKYNNKPRPIHHLTCGSCGNPFETERIRKYCSIECRPSRDVSGYYRAKPPHERSKLAKRRYALWIAQGGICVMCGVPVEFSDASLDHDHNCCDTSAKRACGNCDRGVLHTSCNSMLGFAGDDIVKLSAGIDYLIRTRGVNIDGSSLEQSA